VLPTEKGEIVMKNLLKKLKVKSMLCALCLTVTSFLIPWYGSFLFLGEPEIPEILKED
jgi:accessory gene regulator protein AgrB